MGFVDRLKRLAHVARHKQGERAIDRDEARAEGVSAREIRRRRQRWSKELHARRRTQAFHHDHSPPHPDDLARVLQSAQIVGLFEQIGTLTAAQLNALEQAAERPVVRFSLTKARLRFPGGEPSHAAFARKIFVAVSARENAIGVSCDASNVSRVIEAAGLALAAQDDLDASDVDTLMEPWLTVVVADSV